MKTKTHLLSLMLCAFVLSGCSSIMMKYFGIRNIDRFDQKGYDNFINRLPDDVPYTALIGTAAQFDSVIHISSSEITQHIACQPIQMLYFKADSLAAWHVNCTGKPSGRTLNWNYDRNFEAFPPKSIYSCDSLGVTLQAYRDIYPEIATGSSYTVIVFWTNMMTRISQTAAKTVFDNYRKYAKGRDIRIYLINNDSFFAQMK